MSETAREISGDVSPTRAISALDLRMMPRDELVTLYHRLEAPPFEEMHGEFAASLLDQGSTRGFLLSAFALNMSGRWFGKAFEPTGPKEGHGYNNFMTPRGVRRSWRMRTHMGPSKLPNDTKDAFHLEYSHFNAFKRGGLVGAQLHTMFDEVRKVAPGLYLGIGRVGFTERGRSDLHPFILEGPVAPFVTQD
ncbi:MAG: hypothetical protein JRE19_18540 [Deltaproteobacteria bacterium]|nr:hypothetical protein [Deltaproteobacteria bacterium]